MLCLNEILKVEFTSRNQCVVKGLIKTFIAQGYVKLPDNIWQILDSTLKDIDAHGINNYHYQVIEMVGELLSIEVLA